MKLRVIKILIFLLLLIFCTTIGCFIYLTQKKEDRSLLCISNINYSNKSSDKSSEEEHFNYKEVKGITNILLCGADFRYWDKSNGRTDSIMILTIDSNLKKVKITSIMRDTYIPIRNHGSQKINSAFAYGGIGLLKDTIEKNLNLKIDYYAVINFQSFVDIVDYLQGVDVDVKKNEIKELNKYINDNAIERKNVKFVENPGVQLLNGTQALSYVRIRYNVGGDYSRTERQRIVLNKLIEKMKGISVVKYPKIARELWDNIDTDISFMKALNLAYTIYNMDNKNLDTLQIPINSISKGQIYGKKGWVILTDLKQNGEALDSFIYKDKKYSDKDLDINRANRVLNEYFNK